MLARHGDVFRDIELHLAFRAKTHGRYWKVHQILPNLVPAMNAASLDAFKQEVAALYQKTGGGMGAHIEVSHRGADGSIQLTLYVEGPITAIAQFCEHDFKRIATRVALETALVYHPQSGVVETVVKGGARNHAAVLTLFSKHAPGPTDLTPRRSRPAGSSSAYSTMVCWRRRKTGRRGGSRKFACAAPNSHPPTSAPAPSRSKPARNQIIEDAIFVAREAQSRSFFRHRI